MDKNNGSIDKTKLVNSVLTEKIMNEIVEIFEKYGLTRMEEVAVLSIVGDYLQYSAIKNTLGKINNT